MKQFMSQVIELLRIVASHKQRECHMGQGIKQALRQVTTQVMKRVVTRVRCSPMIPIGHASDGASGDTSDDASDDSSDDAGMTRLESQWQTGQMYGPSASHALWVVPGEAFEINDGPSHTRRNRRFHTEQVMMQVMGRLVQ